MYRNRQILLHLVFLLAFQLTAQSYRIQESLSFKSRILDRKYVIPLYFPRIITNPEILSGNVYVTGWAITSLPGWNTVRLLPSSIT